MSVASEFPYYQFDEVGYWQRKVYPICTICNLPAKQVAVELGYPSKYDMGRICDKCCIKYIDPAIELAKERNDPPRDGV